MRDRRPYYLEKELGWSGIAVDAQEQYARGASRRRATDFFVDLDNEYASTAVDGGLSAARKRVVVPSLALDELLDLERVTKVDFVTMDIEDSEPGALAGFTIRRWKPRLVCVEMHAAVKAQILSYFRSNGYVRLESYAHVTG